MLDCAGCGVRLKETPFCRVVGWFDKRFLQNGLGFLFKHSDGKDAFSTKWIASPFQEHI